MNVTAYMTGLRRGVGQMRTVTRHASPIAFLNRRWDHHAQVSGYSPIADGLGPNLFPGRLIPRTLTRVVKRLRKDPRFDISIHLTMLMKLAGADVLDIVDGDNWIECARSLERLGQFRCLFTFHQCVDRLAELIAPFPPAIIHYAICVSRCQMPLIQKLIAPGGRCWFLPHGVNTDYFSPPPAGLLRAPAEFLCVGLHRRDLRTLVAAARAIQSREPRAIIRLVAPRKDLPPGIDFSPVQTCCDVTDDQLRQLYQRSTALLLPLEAATANNSILEALASGLPIISTDVGGVRDYTDPACALLCPPGDPQAHADAALSLLGHSPQNNAMSHAARSLAMTFSWPRIRQGLLTIIHNPTHPQPEWHHPSQPTPKFSLPIHPPHPYNTLSS